MSERPDVAELTKSGALPKNPFDNDVAPVVSAERSKRKASARVLVMPGLATVQGPKNDAMPPSQPRSGEEPRAPGTTYAPDFGIDDQGIYFDKRDKETGEPIGQVRVCGPLTVLGLARTSHGGSWGYLCEWTDRDGRTKRAVLDCADAFGEVPAFVRPLAEGGLWIAPGQAPKVREFVVSAKTDARARRVDVTGWLDDGSSYVDASGTVYSGAVLTEPVYFDASNSAKALPKRGTLETWRATVGAMCTGNTRLVFAVSAAFAATLVRAAGIEGGGFCFVGLSSTGKTRALLAAQSVIGARDGIATWEATKNAIGAMGAEHNDAPLLIDELGQADGRSIGEALYVLTNGVEKSRAQKDGKDKARRTWRTLVLSTGEHDVEAAITKAGGKAMAGQVARLPSIPADAGMGHGLFDTVHEHPSGEAFADAIAAATSANFGTAWPVWLGHLASMGGELRTREVQRRLNAFRARVAEEVQGSSGEVRRVLSRFAVVAAAGELATEAGITGWQTGEAERAALVCLKAWLFARGGTGSEEKAKLLRHVRLLLETEQARFQRVNVAGPKLVSGSEPPPRMLGYLSSDGDTAFIPSESFREHFATGSAPQCIRWLLEDGILEPGAEPGRHGRKVDVGGHRQRLMVVNVGRLLDV